MHKIAGAVFEKNREPSICELKMKMQQQNKMEIYNRTATPTLWCSVENKKKKLPHMNENGNGQNYWVFYNKYFPLLLLFFTIAKHKDSEKVLENDKTKITIQKIIIDFHACESVGGEWKQGRRTNTYKLLRILFLRFLSVFLFSLHLFTVLRYSLCAIAL